MDWNALSPADRVSVIAEQIREISVDGIAPTHDEWNRNKPDWMPKVSAIGNYFAIQFSTMAMCLGYKIRAKQTCRPGSEYECECGKPLQTYRLAQVGSHRDGTFSEALIPLCNQCAELWDEVEN